jgi:hypothetical protein
MKPLRIGLLAPPDQQEAAIREYLEEQSRRMSALADSLGIPDNVHRWYELALHLARQHVPELRDQVPQGSPVKWGEYELAVLAVELEREQERQGGVTINHAARVLAKREPWLSFLQEKGGTAFGPDPGAALVRKYSDAKKIRLTAAARGNFKYHVHQGTVAEWDAEVRAIATPQRK